MTICDSLLSLLFFVPIVSAKDNGVVFIPDVDLGGYKGVFLSLLQDKMTFLRVFLFLLQDR